MKTIGFDYPKKLQAFEKAAVERHSSHNWKELIAYRKAKKALLGDYMRMMEIIQKFNLGE